MKEVVILRAVVAAIIIAMVDRGFCRDATIPIPSDPKLAAKASPQSSIHIKADTYSYAGNILTADGNVSVRDGEMELMAAKMTVETERIDGKLAYKRVQAIGTDNTITLKTAQGTATGKAIDYDVTQGVAILSGATSISFEGGGQLSGADSIILNRTKQTIRTTGGQPHAVIPHAVAKGEALNPPPETPTPTPKPDAADSADAATPAPPTEISAKTIAYDITKGIITFTGDVHVIDNDMDLKGDSLTVYRNKAGAATRITVSGGKDGRVSIKNPNGMADGPRADYDLVKGILEVTGKANLRTTTGMVFTGADKVVYNRDKQEFFAKGGTIKINNTTGGSMKNMLKPLKKK